MIDPFSRDTLRIGNNAPQPKKAPTVATQFTITYGKQKTVDSFDLHSGNLLVAIMSAGGKKPACQKSIAMIREAVHQAKLAVLTSD
jgi:hypothetical protein